MKILITDALSEMGLNMLREAEHEVVYKIIPHRLSILFNLKNRSNI